MRRLARWLFLLLLLPLAWYAWHALHAPPPAATLSNGASLSWQDCWFDTPLWRPVHCARLQTREAESRFSLPVIYIPAWFWQSGKEPLLYIAGGPGGANWLDAEEAPQWLEWAAYADFGRDIILYDQRGVGLSDPALDCPEMRRASLELLPQALEAEAVARRVQGAMHDCHRRLLDAGVDLEAFTTRHNAADAADLAGTLGASRIAVYAVSYGTRVALELMRARPELVEAAVLDSVYPPQVSAELSDPWLLDRALVLYSRICELAASCEDSRGELQSRLERAMDRLRRRPLGLNADDPHGEGRLEVRYTADDLAWLVFEAMYQTHRIPQLPRVVDALARGEVSPELREMINDSVRNVLDDSLSDAVASSVDCHDDVPVSAAEASAVLAAYPRVADIKLHDWAYHPCRFWRSGDAGPGFRAPVVSGVPTLLLAGELDPVTPPEWAELAARTLSRGLVFTAPGVGHGVFDTHACSAEMARAFLASPFAPVVPGCLSAP